MNAPSLFLADALRFCTVFQLAFTIARITESGTPAAFSSFITSGEVSKLPGDRSTLATITFACRPTATHVQHMLVIERLAGSSGVIAIAA